MRCTALGSLGMSVLKKKLKTRAEKTLEAYGMLAKVGANLNSDAAALMNILSK